MEVSDPFHVAMRGCAPRYGSDDTDSFINLIVLLGGPPILTRTDTIGFGN